MKKDTKQQTGTIQKEARRKVLRNTLIGGAVISAGAMPDKWRKPALEAVILPSHASTTDASASSAGGNTVTTTTTTPTTTIAPTTTCSPNSISNVCVAFNVSNWTDPIA